MNKSTLTGNWLKIKWKLQYIHDWIWIQSFFHQTEGCPLSLAEGVSQISLCVCLAFLISNLIISVKALHLHVYNLLTWAFSLTEKHWEEVKISSGKRVVAVKKVSKMIKILSLKFPIYTLWLALIPLLSCLFPPSIFLSLCRSLHLPPAGLICWSCSWTLCSTVSGIKKKNPKWSMWEGTGRSWTGQSMVERTLPRALCKWKHVL